MVTCACGSRASSESSASRNERRGHRERKVVRSLALVARRERREPQRDLGVCRDLALAGPLRLPQDRLERVACLDAVIAQAQSQLGVRKSKLQRLAGGDVDTALEILRSHAEPVREHANGGDRWRPLT